jgi:hypothetical protein
MKAFSLTGLSIIFVAVDTFHIRGIDFGGYGDRPQITFEFPSSLVVL